MHSVSPGLQRLARAQPALELLPQRRPVLLGLGQAVVVADDVGTLQAGDLGLEGTGPMVASECCKIRD